MTIATRGADIVFAEGMWVVEVGGLGYVEKLTSPLSPLYTPPKRQWVTNSLRNIPYALADYTTFAPGSNIVELEER